MNKWINPMFWDHPTPVNLLMVVFLLCTFAIFFVVGGGAAVYTMFAALTWVSQWPWDLVV